MCSIIGFCGTGTEIADVRTALAKTQSRGPDAVRIVDTGCGYLGFNRLSIMGLSEEGMQPFVFRNQETVPLSGSMDPGEQTLISAPEGSDIILVCNGESELIILDIITSADDLIPVGSSESPERQGFFALVFLFAVRLAVLPGISDLRGITESS